MNIALPPDLREGIKKIISLSDRLVESISSMTHRILTCPYTYYPLPFFAGEIAYVLSDNPMMGVSSTLICGLSLSPLWITMRQN